MTAYARVLTDPASRAPGSFRGPVRWARLTLVEDLVVSRAIPSRPPSRSLPGGQRRGRRQADGGRAR